MEPLGVACWDFAYPTGRCSASASKSCTTSKSKRRQHKGSANPNPDSTAASSNTKPVTPVGDKKSTTRTYLLSSPHPWSITYPQTYSTISTLLMTPHTQLILLVPQPQMMCSRVCQVSRLPRAGGSGLQILPVPELYPMSCEAWSGTGKDGDDEVVQATERIGVQYVVSKVMKYTRARSFDGYLAFEDDRANWKFLEAVGEGVKAAAGQSAKSAKGAKGLGLGGLRF